MERGTTINGDRGDRVTSPGRRGAATSPAPAGTPAAARRFGEEGGLLTYGGYLRLDELLAQQLPQADPPAHDELLFITVHQVYELWFQQLLFELEAARDAMMTGETWRARHLLRRVHAIERLLIAQVDILETMTPQDFLAFRASLAPASGFQSVQFRELEFLSGAKDQAFLARFRAISGAERGRLERRLAEPSLWDAFVRLLLARGLPAGADGQILASLRLVAADRAAHDDLWQLAEDLLSHDELAGLWRARHVAMVERQIGTKSGTGGSTGAPYLRKRVPLRYFPLLWELRDHL
jgi:tryptophan 2,3-dioxygenase